MAHTLLVGKKAPHFKAKAVVEGKIVDEFSLSDFLDHYVIFFFYPLDFTFVCPTELHAFQEKLSEFKKRHAEVIACSVDSWHTHFAWLNTPKEKGGIAGVTYPVVSDLNKAISATFLSPWSMQRLEKKPTLQTLSMLFTNFLYQNMRRSSSTN